MSFSLRFFCFSKHLSIFENSLNLQVKVALYLLTPLLPKALPKQGKQPGSTPWCLPWQQH